MSAVPQPLPLVRPSAPVLVPTTFTTATPEEIRASPLLSALVAYLDGQN